MSAPVRFLTLKLWAVRFGILALVAVGFGGVPFLIFSSLFLSAVSAFVGVALFARAVLRLTADDIRF